MGNKNFINQYINKNYYLILLLIYISFSKCIIEIPLELIQVKGIPKFGHIAIGESVEDDYEKKKIYNRFLNEGGNVLFNENLFCVANIKIGSNKQQFNLFIDTGSPYTWVAKKGSVDSKYKIINHYDPSTSKTSKNTNIPFNLV